MNGYWIFTNKGRVFTFGDGAFWGDLSSLSLAGDIVSSVPTPSGNGYYMLGSDGGVFAFGDAAFYGSIPEVLPGVPLACDVVGLVPTPTGRAFGSLDVTEAYLPSAMPDSSDHSPACCPGCDWPHRSMEWSPTATAT